MPESTLETKNGHPPLLEDESASPIGSEMTEGAMVSVVVFNEGRDPHASADLLVRIIHTVVIISNSLQGLVVIIVVEEHAMMVQ